MTAQRSRREELTYKKHLSRVDRTVCAFCAIQDHHPQWVKDTKYFKVIKNIFPYSLWDGQKVVDHLMVTPKKHTDSLSAMKSAQKVEYVDLIEEYEHMGYNIYARAPTSVIKSIQHQHTHLIKTAGRPRGFVFLMRKPYFRFHR